jgi:hypothetical protein
VITWIGQKLTITQLGRVYVGALCAAFDAYLNADQEITAVRGWTGSVRFAVAARPW